MAEAPIIARVLGSALDADRRAWNDLLALQDQPTPFMRHEYLAALEASGSATARTGWTPRFMTLWQADTLVGACPLYLKDHSYGEYVFDWSWASAHEQHGVPYYPKAVIAVPFTPVPGTRLLARTEAARALLVQAVQQWCEDEGLSSAHLLFASAQDAAASAQHDWMARHTVQFHWKNRAPTLPAGQGALPAEKAPRRFASFDDFLASLSQDKRKKIRQERRRVAEAGVRFRWALGADIAPADWDFFYRCYERTYLEHGNPPYLTRDFFARMAADLPQAWLMFVAERGGEPIASSLIAVSACQQSASDQKDLKNCAPDATADAAPSPRPAARVQVAYGRYWGALQRVDCLHFEACYYQPLQWCIEQGVDRFEGGAQGEHKMARALLPVQTTSTHWLAHPAFADAVERFLQREGEGVAGYLEALHQRLPFRQAP